MARPTAIWWALGALFLLAIGQAYFMAPNGRTISYSEFKGLVRGGQVAEVSVGKDGAIKVHRVTAAVDCGQTVNPQTIARQIEGAVAQGVGLRAVAAPADGGAHVVLVDELEELERLAGDHARGLALEVLVSRLPVDAELAAAGSDPDASDGGFSFAGCVSECCGHRRQIFSGSGFWAWWGWAPSPYTLSFSIILRPRTFFGSMPLTASSMGRSG